MNSKFKKKLKIRFTNHPSKNQQKEYNRIISTHTADIELLST